MKNFGRFSSIDRTHQQQYNQAIGQGMNDDED